MAMTVREPRAPGILREIGLPRVFAVAAVVVVTLALQSTLLAQATVLGVIPQVVLVVVVSFAYLDGERVGLVTGFCAGLLQDLLPFPTVIGLTALVYTLVGYGVGILRQYAPADSVWTPVLVVALASAVAEFAYASLSIILGEPWVGLGYTARVSGLVVLYNTLLTPFVFPLVRRVADRYRPEKVHRW
ncbi:MAG TPA: rod shape-determining protein MreD [Actinomycetota bacterium]|nr:rod shape-determining protein MreD [Actinomycetota bacterium]